MAKVSFTAQRVQDHICPKGKSQAFLWDQRAPGLGLRVTQNGARAYIFQGKVDSRTVRLTIGDPRNWPIEKAREEARRLQVLIDANLDPREVDAQKRADRDAKKVAERRKDLSVESAWKIYMAARKSKWSDRHYQDHLKLAEVGGREVKRGNGVIVAGPLAVLMPLRLADLSRERVDGWLEAEAQVRPARARLAFSLLRAFITWCESREEFAGLAATDICSNKQIREHLPKATTKEDCLQREQLKAWFGSVRSIGSLVISTYLQGLLITGARREELAGLLWDDVEFQWGSLTIRDKVEGNRTIPLTPYLAELLQVLKKRNETPPPQKIDDPTQSKWKPSPWVFSSKTAADGKITEPRIAHNKALDAAGLPHVSLHGLRRSFGTLSEWVECPVGVVAQIQGHKPSAIAEKHYRRRPLDLLRMWHVKIESWMLEQAGITLEQPAQEKKKRLSAVKNQRNKTAA